MLIFIMMIFIGGLFAAPGDDFDIERFQNTPGFDILTITRNLSINGDCFREDGPTIGQYVVSIGRVGAAFLAKVSVLSDEPEDIRGRSCWSCCKNRLFIDGVEVGCSTRTVWCLAQPLLRGLYFPDKYEGLESLYLSLLIADRNLAIEIYEIVEHGSSYKIRSQFYLKDIISLSRFGFSVNNSAVFKDLLRDYEIFRSRAVSTSLPVLSEALKDVVFGGVHSAREARKSVVPGLTLPGVADDYSDLPPPLRRTLDPDEAEKEEIIKALLQ